MSKTSLRGDKHSFFHTPRRRNGLHITTESNHINIDIEKANASWSKSKKRVHSTKDVKDVIVSRINNNTLNVDTNYNEILGDIALKRRKYLHLDFKLKSSNNLIHKIFLENEKVMIEDIDEIISAKYTTHWKKIKESNLKSNTI